MSESYKLIKLLGEGSHGKCYLVEAQTTKTSYVIKQIDIRHMTPEEKQDTIKEASILGSLDHPYIIKLKEAYVSKKGKLCIVMDYADGGDLSTLIKNAKSSKISEDQIISWFVQICLALKHIHDRKILHRDLKSQNIFLTKEGSIKLGDFGIAKVLSRTMENAKTVVGTPYYLSPELIDNKPYNFKSDIWALGILLYEMCALEPPFMSNSIHGLALKIVRGVYNPLPSEFSRELRSLLSTLLSIDPRQRPSIHEILKYPIILSKIQRLLSQSQYNEEFSHTIIHSSGILEEKSARKKRKMLNRVKRRRRELDSENGLKDKTDKEKIICEMAALVLEDEESELTQALTPDPSEDYSDEGRNGGNGENEKAAQFRTALVELIGPEIFNQAYEIIRRIANSEEGDDLNAYSEGLKHIWNHKLQKKFVPMLKALIEME